MILLPEAAADLAWLRTVFAISLPLTLLLMLAVARGWSDPLDRMLLSRLGLHWPAESDRKPPKLMTAARDLTALGGDMLRALFVIACAVGLLADGRGGTAGALTGLYASARLFLYLFKRIVRRPRPDVGEAGVAIYTSSFPSGHTFMTIVAYLSAAILIPTDMPAAFTRIAIGFALIAGMAVGVTRMSFRVHWPSDVAAGWLGGIAWTSGALLLLA